VTGFEDDDEDENENEAPCEGGSFWNVFLGLKPQAESCRPFGTKTSLTPVRKIDSTPTQTLEDETPYSPLA